MMKRRTLALLGSALSVKADALNMLPLQDSIGKLAVSVDPRMELPRAA